MDIQVPSVNSDVIASSSIWQWVQNHWLLTLMMGIAILLLIFVVLVPAVFSFFRKSKKISETKNLKKDLMIWKNLSNLVQGGEKAQRTKKELSFQLQTIRMMFKQGIELLAQTRKKKYDVPWFIMLGEPQAGKSTILKNCDLDLRSSANLESASEMNLPLNCWVGPKMFVLDISGKVFFDRWVEGSSAEWDYIIKLIKRTHGRHPLDGIVLTIPADALLADDIDLTKQKAALIGSELYQLLNQIGMNLPCHVVVTKMDMLLGFREYFASFSEEERRKVFGWANQTQDGIFDSEEFGIYWEKLIAQLNEGTISQMLNQDLFLQQQQQIERIDVNGRSYLFPDSVNMLRRNLEIYLLQVFGKDGWNGHDQSILSGVYFTSAKDTGIVLAPNFANVANVSMDEAVIVSKEGEKDRICFVNDLFRKFVFSCLIPATFTIKERFKRQFFAYIFCLVTCGVSGWLLFSAFYQREMVREKLNQATSYYVALANIFEDHSIDQSPLIANNRAGKTHLLTDYEMVGTNSLHRLEFFYDAHHRASEEIILPLGFRWASWLHFGVHRNFTLPQRQFIFNMIQSRMSFIPTVKAMQEHILQQSEEQAITEHEREAIFDFAKIIFAANEEMNVFMPLDNMLYYLIPNANIETINLLSDYHEKHNSSNQHILAQIFYDYNYAQAQKKCFDLLLKAWSDLEIYPNTPYPILRKLLRNSTCFMQNIEKMHELAAQIPENKQERLEIIRHWTDLHTQQLCLQEQIDLLVEMLSKRGEFSRLLLMTAPVDAEKDMVVATMKNGGSVLSNAVADYRKRLAADHEDVLDYVRTYRRLSSIGHKHMFFTLDEKYIDNLFLAAEHQLTTEVETLEAQIKYLQKHSFFSAVSSKGNKDIPLVSDSSGLTFKVLKHIVTLADEIGTPKTFEHMQDFSSVWDNLVQKTKQVLDALNELDKEYEEDATIQAVIKTYKRLVQMKSYNNFMILAENLVKLYPENEIDLISTIKEFNFTPVSGEELLHISPILAKETIGNVAIPEQYMPKVALTLLEPYAQIEQFSEYLSTVKLVHPTPLQYKLKPEIVRTLRMYIEGYLKFWGGYPDSLAVSVKTWADFRALCNRLKPYEINSLLLTIYKSASEHLLLIPAKILTPEQKKYRDSLLADINAKIQILTPHFSEICIKQMSSWGVLPTDTEAAYQFLHSRPNNVLLSDYLAVVEAGNKGDIPWWSRFFKQGVAMLRKEASQEILGKLNYKDTNMFRFPLCADAVHSNEFTFSELAASWEILEILGTSLIPKKKEKVETDNDILLALQSLDITAQLDKTDVKWLTNLIQITDALTNQNKPLVWTLTVPDINQQKKLSESFLPTYPLAYYRFRYVAVKGGAKDILKKQALTSQTIVRGGLDDHHLDFRFYAHAHDEQHLGHVEIPGDWSILHLYLSTVSYFEPEKQTLYVPLYIKDQYDIIHVLWVGLSFNKKLPIPQEWPSTDKWPDFSDIQKNYYSNVMTEPGFLNIIQEHETYETLLASLHDKRFVKHPEFELTLGNVASPFFLENRYVELVIAGQEPKRFAATAGVKLGTTPLSTPGIKIRFYKHSDSQEPSAELSFDGAYAPLRMLTTKNRKFLSKILMQIECEIDEHKVPLQIMIK